MNITNTIDAFNKKIFLSLYSGDLYELPLDEAKTVDQGQVPLSGYPKSNCKKCHGRGYQGKDITSNLYIICSCLRKKIDFNKFENKIEVARTANNK